MKVKVGIPESFKVGWYRQKITGSSHLKYPIVLFWYSSAAYQAHLVSPWLFWRLAKIETMARPNSPDMPSKFNKKVTFGISKVSSFAP